MTESEKLKLVEKLKKYISKNLVEENLFERSSNKIFEFDEYTFQKSSVFSEKHIKSFVSFSCASPISFKEEKSVRFQESLLDKVKNIFSTKELTFQERLFEIIREQQIDEVELYTKAQITKQTFSKIRSNKNYKPTKNTAFLLILALNLNLDEANDLLSRTGITFSPSEEFDLAIKYFIENKIYDIFLVNEILLQSGIKTLAG